jgi:ATP-dependent DNA helicase RecG
MSPGGVFGSVTVENFGQPGITAYRNPNLAEAMRSLGFVQRYGIGIPLARRLLQEAGHPEIGFHADMNNVLVNIRSRGVEGNS